MSDVADFDVGLHALVSDHVTHGNADPLYALALIECYAKDVREQAVEAHGERTVRDLESAQERGIKYRNLVQNGYLGAEA